VAAPSNNSSRNWHASSQGLRYVLRRLSLQHLSAGASFAGTSSRFLHATKRRSTARVSRSNTAVRCNHDRRSGITTRLAGAFV